MFSNSSKDHNAIVDVSMLRPGDVVLRRWPYESGETYYHARVIEMEVQPIENQKVSLTYF